MIQIKRLSLLVLVLIVLLVAGCSTASAVYDRDKAVSYATHWAKTPNSNQYHVFPTDCANFVSQCLYAGGWQETGSYDDYLSPDAWYYDYYTWPARWCKGYSRTWAVANDMTNFLNRHPERAYSKRYIFESERKAWGQRHRVGDVVVADWEGDGYYDHAMIITKVKPTEIYLSYHTPNKSNVKLTEIMHKYPKAYFLSWRIG